MTDPLDYIRKTMRPLERQATGWDPVLPTLPDIRAVVFDIYGTLLISAAGDHTERRDLASSDPIENQDLILLDQQLGECIHTHHARRRAEGIDYPEVEIRDVWAEVMKQSRQLDLSREEIEALALRHECKMNPVWPMPHAASTLAALKEAGYPLGIISNAQFYTTPVVEALLGHSLDELGFHPNLRVFSYELLEGKPSPRLYEQLRDEAIALGISPSEILYLGNDMNKDILPARALGFRTGLFAGDARSLRLGSFSRSEVIALADAVITDLAQIPDLLETSV